MPDLRSLGQYRIEALLGSGAYTDTYRAVDTVRRRPVALKILHSIGGVAMGAFLQRAAQAADLVHPHLAWVWEATQIEDTAYIAERYVNGAPLSQMIVTAVALTWEEALRIVRQIAQGLDFAHARNWVHGDVKPQNILLSAELGAVLTDFGLVNALRSKGVATGSALYTAPEIWEGQPPGPASDQYALVCILVEMLTGQPLFAAPTAEEIQTKHLAGLELLPVEPSGIPWQTIPVLRRALGRNPATRYPSLGDFVEALARLGDQVVENPEEHARREEAARAWRASQQEARNQADESARLAALEQARREIEEQLQSVPEMPRDGEITPPPSGPPGVVDVEPDLDLPEFQVLETSRRRPRRARRRGPGLILLLLVVIIVALGGIWLDSRISREQLFPPTATSTSPAPTMTSTDTASPLPTVTGTPTFTLTFTSTHTWTVTTTSTPTATQTLTPTVTLTPTHTFTPSPTRKGPTPMATSNP
jgi:serine/threonine protein kinase